MDHLRTIVEWIAHRKILSASVASIIVIAAVIGHKIILASEGCLSEPIQRGSIVDAVYGIGTVTATNRLSFNPLVGNTIKKSFVTEGDIVKKGHAIAVTADGNELTAPFDGTANYVPYHVGENAYTTTPMLVFTDQRNLYIVVSMEQQGALRVKPGQAVKISFDSLRNQTFDGNVAVVYSYNSNFLARIDQIKLPESVLPDMTCDVAIVIGVHENALVIPAVAFDNGKVWVKHGSSIPKAVPVKLGVIDGTSAEVIEGDIQPGDRVVVRDQVGL